MNAGINIAAQPTERATTKDNHVTESEPSSSRNRGKSILADKRTSE